MHGLMFGGFQSIENYMGGETHIRNEYYRSFGNHRIATHLRKQGWDIEVLDYSWAFSYEELKDYVDARITKETVFIGVSVLFIPTRKSAEDLNRILRYISKKYPWVKSIAGGVKSWAITFIQADYYIAGHGEYALVGLLKSLMGRGEPVKFKTNLKSGIKIIDAYQDYPCWPKRDANISYEERDFITKHETMNIELSRGCRFKCKYCTFPLLGIKDDTSRDEDSVYEELKENYEKWGTVSYYITDDTVNDRPEKMRMLANAVRRLDFRPHFNGYARADLLISHPKETWDDMIDAGFTSHSYGVETFNHMAGKSVGKGMHPDKTKEGLLEIQEYFTPRAPHFYTGSLTMICGLPHETFQSLDDGRDWLNKYWRNHAVGYLPLLLQPNDNDAIDEVDGNITQDFVKMGYTFHEADDVDHLLDMVHPFLRKGLKVALEERAYLQKNKDARFNYWIHPSGDYDWLDALEWVMDFINKRGQIRDGIYCFKGEDAWKTESVNGTLENIKDYYKENRKEPDYSIKHHLVMDYKRRKLAL